MQPGSVHVPERNMSDAYSTGPPEGTHNPFLRFVLIVLYPIVACISTRRIALAATFLTTAMGPRPHNKRSVDLVLHQEKGSNMESDCRT